MPAASVSASSSSLASVPFPAVPLPSSELTLYVWRRGDGHIGHASMQIHSPRTYISFGPAATFDVPGVSTLIPGDDAPEAPEPSSATIIEELKSLFSVWSNANETAWQVPSHFRDWSEDVRLGGTGFLAFSLFGFDVSPILAEFRRFQRLAERGSLRFGVSDDPNVFLCSSLVWHLLRCGDTSGRMQQMRVAKELMDKTLRHLAKRAAQGVEESAEAARAYVDSMPSLFQGWVAAGMAAILIFLVHCLFGELWDQSVSSASREATDSIDRLYLRLRRWLDHNLRSPELLIVFATQQQLREMQQDSRQVSHARKGAEWSRARSSELDRFDFSFRAIMQLEYGACKRSASVLGLPIDPTELMDAVVQLGKQLLRAEQQPTVPRPLEHSQRYSVQKKAAGVARGPLTPHDGAGSAQLGSGSSGPTRGHTSMARPADRPSVHVHAAALASTRAGSPGADHIRIPQSQPIAEDDDENMMWIQTLRLI